MNDWTSLLKADPVPWLLENTYSGRFRVSIEREGAPSKWVTLLALRALRAWLGEPIVNII